MNLACVVVFYNPSDDNISNIDAYKGVVDKVYVVDNSDDEIVRLKDDKVIKYIKLGKNLGIAKALNIGARRAIDDGFKWLLTMDQDSKITKQNVLDMISFLKKNEDDKVGLISPFQDIQMNEVIPDIECEDMIEVMTSGNIINLDVYQKIGGFKDWLFIDCVDTEYCMNLHRNGYKVLRLNRVVMEHHLGDKTFHKFFGKIYDCSNHSAMRRYYITRNNLYIRDMYSDIYPDYCKRLIRIQKGQVKRVLMFEKQRMKKLKMIIKGYIDYKKGVKGKMK